MSAVEIRPVQGALQRRMALQEQSEDGGTTDGSDPSST